MSQTQKKAQNIALLGIFSAIVVVLQLFSYIVRIGTFNLSLVLIPIVLGGVLYGPKFGGILGLVFGVVTLLTSAFGLDQGGSILFAANPFLTALLCLTKGTVAGFVAACIARPFQKKNPTVGTILAALSAPILNTGIFLLLLTLFFKNVLVDWAAGTAMVYYIIFSLVGINFLIELAVNLILSPVLLRVIALLKRIH